MSERRRDLAFMEIMQGQIPSMRDRIREALTDPEVHAKFEAASTKSVQDGYLERLDYANFMARKYGFSPDEIDSVSYRLESRRASSNG